MDVSAEYNKQVKEATESIELDFDLECNWYHAANIAMEYASPLGLGLTAQEMMQIHAKLTDRKKLTYYEFACANNNLEARSAQELRGLPYYDIMVMTGKYAELWNAAIKPMADRIMGEIVKKGPKHSSGFINGLRPT